MKTTCIVACVLAALCAPAWAINKCTAPNGKVQYQDAPCTGKGEQVSVHVAPLKAPLLQVSASGVPLTEAQRIEAQVAQSQAERRRRELEEIYVPQAKAVISQHRTSCADTQARLQASQHAYKQNLYGKTHAAQMASEMAATASRCETKDRELTENLTDMQKECESLGCKKTQP